MTDDQHTEKRKIDVTATAMDPSAALVKWDVRFLKLARHIAGWSKDPSSKIGCIVVGPDREIRATGFNGFPRGVADDGRLDDRESKYPLICHAEENAVAAAARVGVSLKGCVAYATGFPCTRCARSLIQAGIAEVVSPEMEIPERWRPDCERAEAMLKEARVRVRVPRVPGWDEDWQ